MQTQITNEVLLRASEIESLVEAVDTIQADIGEPFEGADTIFNMIQQLQLNGMRQETVIFTAANLQDGDSHNFPITISAPQVAIVDKMFFYFSCPGTLPTGSFDYRLIYTGYSSPPFYTIGASTLPFAAGVDGEQNWVAICNFGTDGGAGGTTGDNKIPESKVFGKTLTLLPTGVLTGGATMNLTVTLFYYLL
ncbi:hypothetical protein [Crucivirus-534]|nr:hypothetical protein [Crucivirus-534]